MSIERENTCWGCREDQPNQLAHMDPGGCLEIKEYSQEKSIVISTCDGCLNDEPNELAHMEPGGCLHRPRYSIEEYSDEEIVFYKKQSKESCKTIIIDTHSYYYDTQTQILYTDKQLKKSICRYDEMSGRLMPL